MSSPASASKSSTIAPTSASSSESEAPQELLLLDSEVDDDAPHFEALSVFVDALLALLPGGASAERSAVTEVGNIALGGFLDGWANYLGKAIDMTPPRYFEADGAAVLPDGALAGDGVFLFESRLDATTTDLDSSIYMLPDSGPFRDLIVGKTAPSASK